LQTKDGKHVLKAVQSPPRGIRELEFYKKIFTNEFEHELDKNELELRNLIPIYRDTVHFNGVTYIKMDDITHGICEPSVMDLKMGQITYDPEANEEKILRQQLKYPPQKTLGFQLLGMRVSLALIRYLHARIRLDLKKLCKYLPLVYKFDTGLNNFALKGF
jgi:1D-myo-inositol-tetrakisphosphate 5-kinase/inositol-polyphosphate multikinase